jgi:hypothetical protein
MHIQSQLQDPIATVVHICFTATIARYFSFVVHRADNLQRVLFVVGSCHLNSGPFQGRDPRGEKAEGKRKKAEVICSRTIPTSSFCLLPSYFCLEVDAYVERVPTPDARCVANVARRLTS